MSIYPWTYHIGFQQSFQKLKSCGETIRGVANTTFFRTKHLLNVILTAKIHAVIGWDGVETQPNIVHVKHASTTELSTRNGEILVVKLSGERMECVVLISPYRMVRLPSVNLMGRNLVVVVPGMESVVEMTTHAFAMIVSTITWLTN